MCISLFKKERITFYFAECAKLTAEGVNAMGGRSLSITSLEDIMHPKPVDDRTPDEIISGIRAKLKK